MSSERVVEHHQGAQLGEQLAHLRVDRAIPGERLRLPLRVGRLHHRTLADLDGQRGHEAVDRPVTVDVPRAPRAAPPARIDATARAWGAISSATPRSWAGLWQSTTSSARAATSALLASASPPVSCASASRALGDGIEAQHRPPPPAGERARHVAAPIKPICIGRLPYRLLSFD